jgi:hypothetical protein
MVRLAVLVGGSVFNFSVSWCSLRDRRAHGLYRFLVWEAILLLIPLNLERGPPIRSLPFTSLCARRHSVGTKRRSGRLFNFFQRPTADD